MNEALIYFAIKYNGDWNKIFKALEQKEKIELKDLESISQKIKDKEINVVTIIEDKYPANLKNGYKPPFVLFLEGNIDNLYKKTTCLTGDTLDEKSKSRIDKFTAEIASTGRVIINRSHSDADKYILENSQSNVIVLDSGLKSPAIKHNFNPERDLLVTEYPIEEPSSKQHLKQSNRIVAALSDEITLINSEKHGEINHLVTFMLNMGKDVYCLPGEGDELDGNSELIKQGANLATSFKDIDSSATTEPQYSFHPLGVKNDNSLSRGKK